VRTDSASLTFFRQRIANLFATPDRQHIAYFGVGHDCCRDAPVLVRCRVSAGCARAAVPAATPERSTIPAKTRAAPAGYQLPL
jgi:hypothetical protein